MCKDETFLVIRSAVIRIGSTYMQKTYCCRWRFFPFLRYSWWPHQICSSGYIASRYGNSAMAKTTPVAEWQIGKLEAVTDAVICSLNEFRGADQDYRR